MTRRTLLRRLDESTQAKASKRRTSDLRVEMSGASELLNHGTTQRDQSLCSACPVRGKSRFPRSSTRITCTADHSPPRAVGMPCSLRPARWRAGSQRRLACSARMIGRTSAARASASRLTAPPPAQAPPRQEPRVSGRFWRILLKKSEVASVPIFDAILKREAINNSDISRRATEVAYELCVRR